MYALWMITNRLTLLCTSHYADDGSIWWRFNYMLYVMKTKKSVFVFVSAAIYSAGFFYDFRARLLIIAKNWKSIVQYLAEKCYYMEHNNEIY